AGEAWKLKAYRDGQDLYKVLASKIHGTPYEFITAEQRQGGKVGELACGYGAGSGAVKDFAAGMGIEMSEGEATKLVWDWREANPTTVAFWSRLDEMLHLVVGKPGPSIVTEVLPDGMRLRFGRVPTPQSLERQRPGTTSVSMMIVDDEGQTLMKRYFLGCHEAGNNIRYFRPSERKTGDLWRNGYTNAKTKQFKLYELYGGKLAGILTQSLCRELFFQCLREVNAWAQRT